MLENNEIVKREDRERISREAIRPGKDGLGPRIINFDKEIKKLREGRTKNMLITFIPIREDIHKVNMAGYTFVKDAQYDVYYGIPISVYPDGNIKWRRIYIEEKYTFNLENDNDCKEYLVMRMHPDVEGSPFQAASPKYRIFDPELEAIKITKKANNTRLAFGIIDELSGKNLVYFCRNLGIIQDADTGVSVDVLKSKLNQYAIENPDTFVLRYEQESRNMREIITSGLLLGFIVNKGADGFMYNGRLIGLNEESIVSYLKSNPELYIQLAREIEENDFLTISVQKEEKEEASKDLKSKTGSKVGDSKAKLPSVKADDDM